MNQKKSDNRNNMEVYTERANKSVPDLIKTNSNYVECWRNGYIRGASEQEEISKREMINKACEVYKKELREIMNILNTVGGMRDIDDILSFEGCVKDFRKALEL